jgi:hypothetical protein
MPKAVSCVLSEQLLPTYEDRALALDSAAILLIMEAGKLNKRERRFHGMIGYI